jgi:hypothetical protein
MAKSKRQSDSQFAPEDIGNSSESAPPLATSPDTSRDRIAARAYELYEARGRSEGAELDDWLTAERELTSGRPPRED